MRNYSTVNRLHIQRKMKKKTFKIVYFSLVLALLCCTAACKSESVAGTVRSLADMEGKTVGVLAGTVAEESLARRGTAGEVKAYANGETLADDLRAGVLDCAVLDEATARALDGRSRKLVLLDEPFSDQGYRIAIARGNGRMVDAVKEAARDLIRSGELEKMRKGWLEGDGYDYVPADLPEDAGTVTVAIDASMYPYEFTDGQGGYEGFEIDIIRAVCDRVGVRYELLNAADDEQLIYLAESGKVTFAVGRIRESDSRLVEYSDTYVTEEQYVLVRK